MDFPLKIAICQNLCVSPLNQEIPGFLVLVLTVGCLRGAGLYVPYPKVE
jgi:hypothetical protein